MFYVKTQLNRDAMIEVDITDTNVFCRCPFCGQEVPVDLDDFTGDEDFTVAGSEVACEKCRRKFLAGEIK